jgi:ABC-type transport system involved in cytochrome bd biosynthesis fused ATPase/permease subunit
VSSPRLTCSVAARWPLERALFALAGTMTLLSAALVLLVSPWFLALTAFVGLNQWLYVVAGACPASVVLERGAGLRSALKEESTT